MLPSSYLIQRQKKVKNGKIALNLIIFITILILGFIYLLQINNSVSDGYKLREYQKELKKLKEEQKKLELEVVQSQSFSKLGEIAKNLNLILVNEVDYLKVPEERMAAGSMNSEQ